MVFGQLAGQSPAEESVINRSESKLIALERRNQAARVKKAPRVAASDTRSANDEERTSKKTAPAA
jgi:hypothetical protein